MKGLLMAFVVMALVSPVSEAEVFSTLDEYIRSATGKSDWGIYSASYQSNNEKLIFGIAAEQKLDPRAAFIFVLREQPVGKFDEIVRSKPFFGLSDPSGRTDIESIDAQSDRRFSIQVNGRSACGGYVTIYRFAKIQEIWRASGLDNTSCSCGEGNDEAVCDTRTTRSANFLTGKFVKQEFRNNKLVSQKTKTLQFPKRPLSNFETYYDEDYWAE